MARRVQPPDSLDLFPTPPWGTRALIHYVLKMELGLTDDDLRRMTVWDPCAGWRHMADVLQEYFAAVHMTDVFDYGDLDAIGSFVGVGLDVVNEPRVDRPDDPIWNEGVDWVIGNAPFILGEQFARRALNLARVGVALLFRTQWIESGERFALFGDHPLAIFAPFSGRIAMVEGRWDPAASTATSYAWFVWYRHRRAGLVRPSVVLIPPAAEGRLSLANDVARFGWRGLPAGTAPAGPLFEDRP